MTREKDGYLSAQVEEIATKHDISKIELVICIETLAIYGKAEKKPFYNLKIY